MKSSPVKRSEPVVLFGEVLADVFPDRSVLGGAPFNVARHLKAFGQTPVLISRLGNDALRDEVIQVMMQNKMETMGLQRDKSHPTGRVQVHIENSGHRFEIIPLQAYDFIHAGVVRLTALSKNPALVYFGTLAQRHDVSRRALKTLLRNTEAAKFLDINLRTPWYNEKILIDSLLQADIVKMNDEELVILSNMFKLKGNDSHTFAQGLIDRFGLEQILVTCGNAGAWMLDRNGRIAEAFTENARIDIVDTVGAGDGFAAVFILGALQGWAMSKTLERANAFAGAICGIRGAVPDHADFYKSFITEWDI